MLFLPRTYRLAMVKIGLISDTHGFLDPRLMELMAGVDELWHAGDVGDWSVIAAMRELKPTRAVFGNIDGAMVRQELPEHQFFCCEEVQVWMTHIGGYPGKYAPGISQMLKTNRPQLFVCGHSHILRVMYDKRAECLVLNPGACGRSGFHTLRTALRFEVEGSRIGAMEVIELGSRNAGYEHNL